MEEGAWGMVENLRDCRPVSDLLKDTSPKVKELIRSNLCQYSIPSEVSVSV